MMIMMAFLKLKKGWTDIFLLLEVSKKWCDYVTDHLSSKYPYKVNHPLENTYGIMMFSKLKILDSSVEFLIEEGVPSIHCKIKMPTGQLVRFYGLHPKPPAPGENDTSTPRDAELVLAGKKIRDEELPVIVAGDMNDVAWSHTTRLFMRISGLLDPRMGRGFFHTFNAKQKLLRWPLDHFFLSSHFQLVNIGRRDNFNSDHFPIYIEVMLKPSVEALSEREFADEDDLEEAENKIEEAKEE